MIGCRLAEGRGGRLVARAIAVSLTVCSLSCADDEPQTIEPAPPAPSPSAAAPALDAEHEARLRALGYIASEPQHETTGVVRHDRERVQPGWNLYVTQAAQTAQLIDADGQLIHTWRAPAESEKHRRVDPLKRNPPWWWWRTVHLLENGDLLAQTDFGSLVRIDWDSNPLWNHPGRTHHDFDLDANGDIYVLTSRRAEVTGFPRPIEEDFVTALDAVDGQETRRLSILRAVIDGQQLELLAELQAYARRPGISASDPMHTNSLEWLDGRHASKHPAFERGNLLISLAMIGRLAVVDFDAGKVVWSLKGSFRYQHHPTMLENGNILLFDNKGLGNERSRILEIDPASGAEVWSYGEAESERFYSECCGRVYRLDNGNTLVVDSKSGRAFEIGTDRERVWEFRSAHTLGEHVATLNDLLRVAPVSR